MKMKLYKKELVSKSVDSMLEKGAIVKVKLVKGQPTILFYCGKNYKLQTTERKCPLSKI